VIPASRIDVPAFVQKKKEKPAITPISGFPVPSKRKDSSIFDRPSFLFFFQKPGKESQVKRLRDDFHYFISGNWIFDTWRLIRPLALPLRERLKKISFIFMKSIDLIVIIQSFKDSDVIHNA
jgi:hypothetical protein